ncbi:alpha/beta fold hydrolase [Rhabdochromatium marinum]|uniref:alpha/beta fold hydrolase n=1 Tax=Rhabdochromatium marinum TaxID=48729 RepID=UPI00190820F7|nr:alpha/beta fold hydrolase [Rhabdochromatium marinum]MBK1647709.1 alpha/beta hydrolase [Rhabdochromatium marinum]
MLTGYHSRWLGATPHARSAQAHWLLLHGFTGTGSDWAGVWPNCEPALAIDLPGHGCSPDPTGDFRHEIARLLRALPASIDSLAGYSLGGRIALSLMASAPERFQRLLILSAHPGLGSAAERHARRAQDQGWIDKLRQQDIRRFAAAWQRQALFRTQAIRAPAAVRAQHHQRLAQRPEGLARNLACFGLGQMPPTWTAIRAFAGDLYWISGREDSKFSAIGEQVRQQRPSTPHAIIDHCGHNPLIEAPEALHHRMLSLCGRC